MRPRFELDLRGLGTVAKIEHAQSKISSEGMSPEMAKEIADLPIVLNWHLEKAAEKQHTNLDVQKEIYNIQKKKQEIMDRLKQQLSCVDDPLCEMEKMPDERMAQFDEKNSQFKYGNSYGKERVALFGELMTDIDWEVLYVLDKSTPHLLRKKYLIERAKHDLRKLLDSQITRSEVGGDIAHEYKQHAYRELEKERKKGILNESCGHYAELVVKNFLKELSIDKDLPFEIVEGDVFQDVDLKIDFIIRRKERLRGVRVETSEKAENVGIQFTTNVRDVEWKKKQVEKSRKRLRDLGDHVQDIVLVVYPFERPWAMKNRWINEGKCAGGPDKYMSGGDAKALFYALLKDVLETAEIEDSWKKIQDRYTEAEEKKPDAVPSPTVVDEDEENGGYRYS